MDRIRSGYFRGTPWLEGFGDSQRGKTGMVWTYEERYWINWTKDVEDRVVRQEDKRKTTGSWI